MDKPFALVRDVLDKQVYDRNRDKLGKVDGVILTPRAHRPLRITALELHGPTAWRRVWPRLGDWLERFQRWVSPELAAPTRIAFEHVTHTGIDVHADVDAKRTNAYVWETWLERHFVEHVPGGRSGGDKE